MPLRDSVYVASARSQHVKLYFPLIEQGPKRFSFLYLLA